MDDMTFPIDQLLAIAAHITSGTTTLRDSTAGFWQGTSGVLDGLPSGVAAGLRQNLDQIQQNLLQL